MRRDGTTWLIAGVSDAGGGPPQRHVGRFKPKHPRARVATHNELAGDALAHKAPAGTRATAARMRGNGGNAGSGSTKQSRPACAAAVRHEHNTTGHYSRAARTGYA